MSLVAKSEGNFMTVPAGMHLARCYRIIDLGTQKSDYMGQVKYLPKVMMQFEVHGDDDQGNPLLTGDGRPLSITKSFTLTLSDKSTLRKDLQTWRGRDFTAQELKGFELKNVLGAWAMVSVTHSESNGKTYTNIAAIMPVPANIKKAGMPEPVNPVQMYTIHEDNKEVFNSLSENLKKRIMESPEWQEKNQGITEGPSAMSAITKLDDDIPF